MIRDFGGNYYYVKSRRSKKKIVPLFIIFFIIITIVCIVVFTSRTTIQKQEDVAGTSIINVKPSLMPTQVEESGLSLAVQRALSGTKGIYGIVILNLKTNEYFVQNEHRVFESASLYKLWVMATILDQIKKGKLSENSVLNGNINLLYQKFNLASPSAQSTYSTGSGSSTGAEQNDKSIKISINNALEKMITVSDNTTALLLTIKVKLANIASFLNTYGFTDSKLGNGKKQPVTTPYDIAIFYKMLYEGKLIDKASSDRMIELLKWQKLNNKLPKYLPESIVTAHKTGELDEFTHDAGIVYTPKGDYIIVVLSESEPESRFLAEERIALLSGEVFDYFMNKE